MIRETRVRKVTDATQGGTASIAISIRDGALGWFIKALDRTICNRSMITVASEVERSSTPRV